MTERQWGTRGYCTTRRCTNLATGPDGLCNRHAAADRQQPAVARRGTSHQCNRGDCDRPVKARGLCQMHYDRERAPRRVREDKVLPTRARHRAVAGLITAHPEEFRDLYEQALEQVTAEDEELRRLAAEHGVELADDRRVFRLRRGPAAADEDPLDRAQLTEPAEHTCSACSRVHNRAHACPECGTTLGQPVERATSTRQAKALADEIVARRAAETAALLEEWDEHELGDRYRVRVPPASEERAG